MLAVREKPYRWLTTGVVLVTLLSFLGAIGASKLYWGYFVRRPGPDRRLGQIERVISLTAIRSEQGADGVPRLGVDEPGHVYEYLGACRDEWLGRAYYCLSGRVLLSLADGGMLPSASEQLSPEKLDLLYDRLEATGKLVEGAPGYDHAKELRGIALEAEDTRGRRYLFVAVTGRQVSNDHLPYYEFLFEGRGRGAEPRLLSYRRFYYDVAGIEGVEWPVAFIAFLLLGILLLALVWVIGAAIATYQGKDALGTVTAVTVLVLSVVLTLTLGMGGCSVLRPGPTPAPATPEPTVTPAATATLASTSTRTPTAAVAPTKTPLPKATATSSPTPTSVPTRTAVPTPTPEPTHTPTLVPLSRIESIPGSVVLYVEGDGLRSVPHRSLFEHPDLQHLYGITVGNSELAMYLIGGSPVPSPDGRYLLITSPLPSGPDILPGTTWLGDLMTGELTSLGPPSLWATWSPDGHRLTYVLDETLYVWDVEGDEEPVAVFRRKDLRRWYARWSPDVPRDGGARAWIAVASREGPEDRTRPVAMEAYWLVSPDGGTVKHLGTWLAGGMGAAPQSLDWSPDGSMLDTPSAVVVTVDGHELRYDEIFENPPPSAPARYDARFIDPALIPDRRDAWMSHDEQQIAYKGHDGLYLFDRRSQTHVLLATFDVVDPQRVHWTADDRTLLVGSRDRARGEDGTFWGQILAFKPGDGSAPELLMEGEDVYLVGIAPDVLDDSRPKSTPTVEVPLEETPEATPTPIVPRPTPTRAVIEMINLAYEGIGLTFDQPIAETVQAKICPARIHGALFDVPTHACFSFGGYVLPDAAHAPRIEVYPVADYEVRNGHVPETIAELRQLLADRPAAPESIPFLPTMEAFQLLRAQVAYLDFQGGSGVRFLTQYVQEPRAINNRELFYTFQGVTDEGNAYVSAFLPVSHRSLPVHLGVFRDARDTDSWRRADFAAWVEELLNAQDAESFTPRLDQLDALIRSLEVGPRCPSIVPPVLEKQEGPYHGWGKVVDEEYGFVLRYPPSWALKRGPGLIHLCRGKVRLSFVYRRQGEDWTGHWTGIPAGDIEERGTLSVPGGEVVKRELVFEDKLKVLIYKATVGDLAFSARLDDVVTLDYRALALPEALQDQADQIMGSLEVQ